MVTVTGLLQTPVKGQNLSPSPPEFNVVSGREVRISQLKSLIFDIEANNKDVDRVTMVWCICFLDPDTGAERAFG